MYSYGLNWKKFAGTKAQNRPQSYILGKKHIWIWNEDFVLEKKETC